jgi:beta-glucosidase
MPFPSGFVWGAAAAAYQIEGATHADGRGTCVWDMFCRKDGAVFSGHTGDVACDHYHRWKQDVLMMQEMRLAAYRLSIGWPRVLPNGVGTINEAGLAFYDELIDALLEAGITPWVTLFHWDYPYELYCRGGWLNPESPEWFAEYVGVVARRLGDRVKHWITLNEPQCFLGLGHREGIQAPGLKLAWMDVLRAMHHALIAHGRAVQTLREHCKLTPTSKLRETVRSLPAGRRSGRIRFSVTQSAWAIIPKTRSGSGARIFRNTRPRKWRRSISRSTSTD